uniref:Transcription factor DP C-terminal domain-containing protein n=1 Tax=Panagrolaimus davidi TaxID=227884 RepID=A0A914QLM7_9BILA
MNQSFEICDDIEVLKRLGLSRGVEKASAIAAASESPQSEEDRKFIKSCLPPALQSYADEILDGNFVANVSAPAHQQTLASIPAPASQPPLQLQQQVSLPAPSQLPHQHASTSADLKKFFLLSFSINDSQFFAFKGIVYSVLLFGVYGHFKLCAKKR